MTNLLEVESTLTARHQTTVPSAVRRVLALRAQDRLVYRLLDSGEIVLSKKTAEDDAARDPVVGAFLDFLARDMAEHPERIEALSQDLQARMADLVGDVDVDLDQPLSPDDE